MNALRAPAIAALLWAGTVGAAPHGPHKPQEPARTDSAGAANWANWIGRVVPPFPEGFRSNTGGCVGSGSNAEQICARSIGTVDDADDRSVRLYAAELAGRNGNEARWRITDLVPYPKLQRGERVSISTCTVDAVADPGAIAVVDTAVEDALARETFAAVRWAVRLDRASGRFVDLDPRRVQCYNEGIDGE